MSLNPQFVVRRSIRYLLIAVITFGLNTSVSAISFEEHPQAKQLMEDIIDEHGLDRIWVESIFEDAQFQQSVIDLITRPAEKLAWHQYRNIFLTESRAKQGVQFWEENLETLERAEEKYGVDQAIIVAIIGVETKYGNILGKHRVIDSLLTLSLGYPRRSEFFTSEFIAFLKLAREEGLNPFSTVGSYAGAMGIPQFISSSYQNFAVDFNENEKRDLLGEIEDAIGSVANYLHVHGWNLNETIYVDMKIADAARVEPLLTRGLKVTSKFDDLMQAGAQPVDGRAIAAEQPLSLIELEISQDDKLYRACFPNFYVITTYNRSPLYASAVAELAEMIVFAKSP